jgi:hypothetical protein
MKDSCARVHRDYHHWRHNRNKESSGKANGAEEGKKNIKAAPAAADKGFIRQANGMQAFPDFQDGIGPH